MVLDSVYEYVPAVQLVQPAAPTVADGSSGGENVPAGQTEQVLCPVDCVNVPARQIEQVSTPWSE